MYIYSNVQYESFCIALASWIEIKHLFLQYIKMVAIQSGDIASNHNHMNTFRMHLFFLFINWSPSLQWAMTMCFNRRAHKKTHSMFEIMKIHSLNNCQLDKREKKIRPFSIQISHDMEVAVDAKDDKLPASVHFWNS